MYEESAVKEVLSLLKSKGYEWEHLHYINHNRYCIVTGKPNIAILLKTEPFFNFGKMFNMYGCKGVGDSINTRELKIFLANNVQIIYTMFRDGKIYNIPLIQFLNKSHKWQNKEGKNVRSISIHEYMRVN